MMKNNIQSEDMNPSQMSKKIIQEAIEKIKPDMDSLNQWYCQYSNGQKKRLSFDLDHLQHHVPIGSKILEIGSIPLILTTAMNQLGYKIQGVDISPERFQTAINVNKLDVLKHDIETEILNFESNNFDVVIFNEIFEHLRINPIHTMNEMLRVLKPGGILMLSTPNFMSLRNIKLLIQHNKCRADIYTEYFRLQEIGHMGHVRLYTTAEVSIFLQKIGFETTKIIFRGSSDKISWKGVIENRLFQVFPKLRPFFSLIAKKEGK